MILSVPVVSCSVLLPSINCKRRATLATLAPRLPPGPPKLPLIGNLHQLIGPLPHHTLANLAKEHGPIMHLQLGEQFAVVVSSPEIAQEVLRTNEISFAQRPTTLAAEVVTFGQSGVASCPYGDHWKKVRKMCVLDLLSAKRVESFKWIREEEVWEMVKSICRRSEGDDAINLSPMVFTLTSNVTSRAAFGFKDGKDLAEFMSVLHQALVAAGGLHVADLYPSIKFLPHITGFKAYLEKIQTQLSNLFDRIIQKRCCDNQRKKHNPTEESINGGDVEMNPPNLLDVLLQLDESSYRNKQEIIKDVILDIFVAGSETTATTIEWAMTELIINPKAMEKAQAEVRELFKGKTRIEEADIVNLHHLKLVIKETLRLHPPAVLLAREAREECEISGYDVPIKTKMIINTWALGRDPNYWSEPEAFIPERFQDSTVDFKGSDFEFLAFGAGRRMCPGIQFAVANIELALAQMLYHFDWKLPPGVKPQQFDMTETFGVVVRKKHNLELIPTTINRFSRDG